MGCCGGEYCHYLEDDKGDRVPKAYSVSLQRTSWHCWVLRTHDFPNGAYGDDWIGITYLRAERYVPGDGWEWLGANWYKPWRWFVRPVAHMFATVNSARVRGYPLSAHKEMEKTLRAMGFTVRYHEKKTPEGMRVVVTDLATRKKIVTLKKEPAT